jgi:hypothetical protein
LTSMDGPLEAVIGSKVAGAEAVAFAMKEQ